MSRLLFLLTVVVLMAANGEYWATLEPKKLKLNLKTKFSRISLSWAVVE